MIWLISRLIVWPVKAVVGTAAFGAKSTARTAAGSAKLGYRTGRLFGYRNLVVLGLGAAAGLALAPRTGRETRDLVRQRLVDLGLVGGGGWSAEAPSAYAPIETPSPAPDEVAAGNGFGGEADVSDEPGPVVAGEPRIPDEPGTND